MYAFANIRKSEYKTRSLTIKGSKKAFFDGISSQLNTF